MASFIIQAVASSFYQSGDAIMVSTPFATAPLLWRQVEVKSEAQALAAMDTAQEELAKIGAPYSLRLILPRSQRAPNGFKAWTWRAKSRDEAFGQIEGAK